MWGWMELLAFHAFYEADPAAFPMEFSHLVPYVWLQQAFLALFMVWLMDADIFTAIQSGGVAYELARPLDIYAMWFVRGLASRAAKALLRSAPILLITIFLPHPYRMGGPVGPAAAVWFVLTMVLAALCVNAFCMLVYVSAFYTINPMGIRIVATTLTEFLSGSDHPAAFLAAAAAGGREFDPLCRHAESPPKDIQRRYRGRRFGGGGAAASLLADCDDGWRLAAYEKGPFPGRRAGRLRDEAVFALFRHSFKKPDAV